MPKKPIKDPPSFLNTAETYRSEMREAAVEFQQALSYLKSSKVEASSSEGVHERRDALAILFRYIDLSGKYEAALRSYAAALETKVKKPDGLHRLHPGITKVSGRLFRDGHYAPAIFEAFKAVNSRVKASVSETGLDNTPLMAHAFNPDKPQIRLTPCRTRPEKDEQRGLMLIYMGAMQGIRNPKAHDPVVQKDREKTFEYLCLASLLMRRIDEAVSATVSG